MYDKKIILPLKKEKRYENGRLAEEYWIDAVGNPVFNNKEGFSSKKLKYNENGNLIGESYFGLNGEPVLNKDGVSIIRYIYNEKGYAFEVSFFDVNGRPTLFNNMYAIIRTKFDEHGNPIVKFFFDTDGKLNNSCPGWTLKYDEKGNQIERSFFDINGEPKICASGYVTEKSKYDENVNQIEKFFYYANGELATYRNVLDEVSDFAGWKAKYDEHGNMILQYFYDANGHLSFCNRFFAVRSCKYDERGNKIAEAYYGLSDEPVLSSSGYFACMIDYDEQGNKIKVSYFDTDRYPIACRPSDNYLNFIKPKDYFEFSVLSNSEKNTSGQSKPEKNIEDPLSISKTVLTAKEIESLLPAIKFSPKKDTIKKIEKFDENGNFTGLECVDSNGNPALCEDGYAFWEPKFDADGKKIAEYFYGIDRKPILNVAKTASIKYKYDDNGDCIEKAYLGLHGEPVLNRSGYAVVKSEYDEHRNKIEETYLGLNGELTPFEAGLYAGWRARYNEHHCMTKKRFFGVDEESRRQAIELCSTDDTKQLLTQWEIDILLEEISKK